MAISNRAPTMAAERRRPTCRPRTKVIGTHSAFSSACTVRPIVSASHGNTNDNTAASRAIDRPSTPSAARDRPVSGGPGAGKVARVDGVQVFVRGRLAGQAVRGVQPTQDGHQREPEQDQDVRRHVQPRPRGGVLRRLGVRSRQDGGPAGHQFLDGVSGSPSAGCVDGAPIAGAPAKCISTNVAAAYAGRPSVCAVLADLLRSWRACAAGQRQHDDVDVELAGDAGQVIRACPARGSCAWCGCDCQDRDPESRPGDTSPDGRGSSIAAPARPGRRRRR